MGDDDSIDTYTEIESQLSSATSFEEEDDDEMSSIYLNDKLDDDDDNFDDDENYFANEQHREMHLFLKQRLRRNLKQREQEQQEQNRMTIHGHLKINAECQVCFCTLNLYSRLCCSLNVCISCMSAYTSDKIKNAQLKIECINSNCKSLIHRDEIVALVSVDLRQKYAQFLVDANKEINVKTCPRCSQIMKLDRNLFTSTNAKQHPSQVTCDACSLEWCFQCHAPWHSGITCKKFKKGDEWLKKWAKERNRDERNARKCPKCEIYIQRSNGCDHMECTNCSTQFCYKCGERYRSFKLIGDHSTKYGIFGCKYLVYPHEPVKRRLLRGSIFGGKMFIALPLLGSVAVLASVMLLGVAVVALPVYGSYKLIRKVHAKSKHSLDLDNPKSHVNHYVIQIQSQNGSSSSSSSSQKKDRVPRTRLYRIDESDSEFYFT